MVERSGLFLDTMEKNEVLALFMGMKPDHLEHEEGIDYDWKNCPPGLHWAFEDAPPFDRSWEWIMPVVEVIRCTGYANEIQFGISNGYSIGAKPNWSVHIGANITRWKKDANGEIIYPMSHYKLHMETVFFTNQENLLDAVFKACVAFVEWYNANKQL